MNELDTASEAIEREALLSLHANCPEDTRAELGLFLEQSGDAIVAGATRDPSILLNRTLGMGTSGPATRRDVERINAIYQDHGVDRYFLHVYPDTVEGGTATVSEVGLVPARGWMKFQRDDAPSPPRDTDLDIRRVGVDGAADFGRIVAGAFGMTPAAGPLLAGLVRDPRWYLFVSYDGANAAGAGALMVADGVGWFEWGATDVAYRRRGSQGSIMRARIAAAREAGCRAMFTETGEASGDDPQHSYGNIQRFGFRESILRQNWAPPK